LKGRESRSDQPEVYYHQSPKSNNVDDTLPLSSPRCTSVHSVAPRNHISQLLESFHVTPTGSTATLHALGAADRATGATTVEYRDSATSDTDTSDHTSSPMTSALTSPNQGSAVAPPWTH